MDNVIKLAVILILP